MKLNRRYGRNLRENLSFYVSSTVLTVITLLFFFLYTTAGYAIKDFSSDFFAENHLEDAHFETYKPLSQEDIARLEKEYTLTLEAQPYVHVTTDGVKARIFRKTHDVDLYAVTEGRDVAANDEIVISEGFALYSKKAIGDSLSVGDSTYKVTGYIQRPDYLYMLENEGDAYKNVSTFFLAYVTDERFETLQASNVQYLVRYQEESDITAFRKAVHDQFIMRSYVGKDDNPRIQMVTRQADLFVAMAYVLLCVLPFIVVALLCIIISRKVKSEQRMIGALSAMGYRKGQLMAHYAGFAAIPGVAGGLLTVLISSVFAQSYSEAGLMDYEPMRVVGRVRPLDGVLGIVVPTLIYVAAGAIAVWRLLKKDTVLLLAGNADGGKNKKRRFLVNSSLPVRHKFALRCMLGNPARSLVVVLGVFLGSFIILVSGGMQDTMQNVLKTDASSFGTFEYQYVLNGLQKDNTFGGEKLLMVPVEGEDGKVLTIIGTANGNPYLSIQDEEGRDVLPEDGYYISSLAQYVYGWQPGETVVLRNPLTMETAGIKVAGVVHNHAQKAIYTSREKAASIAGVEGDYFNALVSDKELPIPKEQVAVENRRADVEEQLDNMLMQMGPIIGLAYLLGVIMCLTSVYAAVNMMVSENRGNISMLKVLGYTDSQIDRIVLHAHHLLVPVGLLLSVPASYAAFRLFWETLVDYGVMLLTTYVSLSSYLLAFGLTVLSYMLSLWFLRRKIKKINMVESLKDNRE